MMTQQTPFCCLHCNAPTDREQSFCCQGCKTVYELLNECKLQQFYTIKNTSSSFGKEGPVQPSGQRYGYLDSEEVIQQHATQDGLTLAFYIEGIHCHACIWLIEKLPKLVPDIVSAEVNLDQHTVTLTRTPDGSFSKAAMVLDTLGYRLYLQEKDTKQRIQQASVKSSLLRIGIAGACAANIMILSFSIYAGLEGTLKTVFEWLSAGLMIPILGFSAQPFFKSAWASIRLRTINIDLPIVAALILGGSMSVVNLIRGHGAVYFDSLAMFVFLVLSIRHMFLSSYNSLDFQGALTASLLPNEAWLRTPGGETRVPTSRLNRGDVICVKPEDMVPADGIVTTEGYVDVQLLTGEALPTKKVPGDSVLAGMKNSGDEMLVTVEYTGSDTRLGALIQRIKTAEKPRLVQMADRVAHWFLIVTLALSVGLFGYYAGVLHDIGGGFQSALALIVLACPCALSLATPLAYALTINRLAARGICIQSSTALEGLTRVRTIFFDKTGTLTKGEFRVTDMVTYESEPFLYELLYALEKDSHHPIASGIRGFALAHIEGVPAVHMDGVQETMGKGVEGRYGGDHYALKGTRSPVSDVVTAIGLFKNTRLIAELFLADTILPEAPDVVATLQEKGYDLALLSGDQSTSVEAVRQKLGMAQAYSELTPEDKVARVVQTPNVLMVGDGANDAEAMLNATVSIAVQGSFEASLRASDIYLVSKSLTHIPEIMDAACKTKRVIWTNFVFSLSYNVLGIVLVVMGYIHPLIAAVIMPLSSLTVISYSWGRLRA